MNRLKQSLVVKVEDVNKIGKKIEEELWMTQEINLLREKSQKKVEKMN